MIDKTKTLISEEDIIAEFDSETILLGLGFIPVIGEVFDIILIIKYFKEKRWIEAFLMMIALIPTVGDAIVKPFLFLGRGLKAFSSTARFAEVLSKSPKFAKMYEKIAPFFKSPTIEKLSQQIIKKEPKLASDIKKAKSFHINAAGKLKAGPTKTLLKRKPKAGVGYGSQQLFRTKAINKYVKKHGKLPPDGLSSWYNIVYKGRKGRKNAFRKALLSSNLLGSLGLPNIEAFEDYISTPDGAEKVMNNPEFSKLYSQTTTSEDERAIDQNINQQQTQAPKDDGGVLSSFGIDNLSIPLMMKWASML